MTRIAFRRPTTSLTLVLAAALAAAGAIHCLLTPEHFGMSALLGAGFLAAGLAQLAMAVLALVRPSRALYAAAVTSSLVLMGVYAYNVMVGLPFRDVTVAEAAGHAMIAWDAQSDGHTHRDDAGADHGAVPGQKTDHHAAGLVAGAGEPVDVFGAATQIAQLSAVVVSVVLLRRARHSAGAGSSRSEDSAALSRRTRDDPVRALH